MSQRPDPLFDLARQVRRPAYRPPPQKSRLATASLVCGIVGFVTCGLTSLAGLVLGIMALLFIRDSDGELEGHSTAVTGIILSAVTLAIGILPWLAIAGFGGFRAFNFMRFHF